MASVLRLFTQLSAFSITSRADGNRLPQFIGDDDKLPRVDVFITYCGEGVDIVANTVKAALVQKYPPSLFRVIVLDDSASTKLAGAIAQLQETHYSNLHYASRNVHVETHSKAANLNFGLEFTDTLQGGSAEFVSVLDVDMIPEPQWLRIVLSYALQSPHAALACPMQHFYNMAPGDPLCMVVDLHSIESLINLQDFTNESFCTGSGFVVRRAALDQIKGFPEESLQEDLLTSIVLSAFGWQTVYVPCSLQWGLAANTFSGWIKQRQRWAAGIISISQYLCSPGARKLPFATRLIGALWGLIDGSASFIWSISMILLPLLVLSGKPLLPPLHLRLLSRLALLDFCAQSLFQALLSSLLDFRMSLLGPVSAIWTAPYRLATTLRFYLLPRLLGYPVPHFTPTGINASSGQSELEARRRNDSCLRLILWDCGAWMHLLCLVVCLAGAASAVNGALGASSHPASLQTVAQALVIRLAWPPLFFLWIVFVKNAWVPLAYAIAPPPFAKREDLLSSEEDTGAAYPKRTVKEDYMQKASQKFWFMVAGYYAVAFLIFEILL